MIIGISVIELHLPAVRSLKQKRQIVRSLVERIHQRMRVSVAETDYHDLHQRAEIGVALVSTDGAEAQRLLERIRALIDEEPGVVLTLWDPQLLEGEE